MMTKMHGLIKGFLTLMFAISVQLGSAQDSVSMRDVFSLMPDSLLPYLSHNNKLDLIDFMDSGMESVVINAFDDSTKLRRMTSDYLYLQLSSVSSLEMKILPTIGMQSDSTNHIVCMVSTFGERAKASTVDFYTTHWTPVHDIANPIKASYGSPLVVCPDSMSQKRFAEIVKALPDMTVSAALSENDRTMTLKACPLQSPTDEKCGMDIGSLLRQISLKWDGRFFKED